MLDDQLLTTLADVRRMRARADALEARTLARLHHLRGGDRWLPREAALELRVSERHAADRLHRGLALVTRLPRVLAAMEAGEIEGYTAGRLVEVTGMLDEPEARKVDDALAEKLALGKIKSYDPTALVRATRRLVHKIDPDGQTARARRARVRRRVELLPGENATSTLAATLPAEIAASCYARVDALARALRRGGEPRTLEQLRADVVADLLLGRDPGVMVPAAAATVFVHMPIGTALTLTDEGCELAGYGPIPAPIAREIMTGPHSLWRKVLTDPVTGAPTDLGRTRRRPSALIRDLVAVRDRECSAPGCHRPAQRSDFDHLTDWGRHHHGTTATLNGGAKCQRCHHLKDQPGWDLRHDPTTGTTTLTTPTGRTYTRHQHPITAPTQPSPPNHPRPSTTDTQTGSDPPPI